MLSHLNRSMNDFGPFGFTTLLLAIAVALCSILMLDKWSTPNFFRQNSIPAELYPSTGSPDSQSAADVTAVLLNWVRLPNVVQIVTVLCGAQLDGLIKEVVVWNNNPQPLADDDFMKCNCSPSKLRIHNSPENLYFQARFLACSNTSTAYCFIQDDDYLVDPEVIQNMRARIDTHDIFLLPPDEVLSSHLLTINSPSTKITFGFSWLGYGALILRSHAESFLALLERLGASQEATNMADNYYSILRNSLPELWTSAPTPLFGGGAFTIGEEGIARNRKHIAAAAEYLDAIAADRHTNSPEWPYVSLGSFPPKPELERSPCKKTVCVLESNVKSFPDMFAKDMYRTAGEIFSRETQLSKTLTEEFTSAYVNFPLSNAVDTNPNTSYRSIWNAAPGDTLVLDIFDRVPETTRNGVEWVWIVDAGTARLLRASLYSYSSDKLFWAESPRNVSCTPYSRDTAPAALEECRIWMTLDHARYFRLQFLEANLMLPWGIYETWLHVKEIF
ncbi:hypothetical protein B0H11DRAFT_1967922 [Mycena galericulata]|nr:hypothetical protein B0H11DRAFT_1967922 [Mycena galericulata]